MSSVVPGYVVLSREINWPGRATWAMVSAQLLRRSVADRAKIIYDSGFDSIWQRIDGHWYAVLATDIDPELQVAGIRPLDESAWQLQMTYSGWFWVVLAAGGAGLVLANAGIYAIMSFTVARRTREIGVRVALGADRRRIVWGVFARTLKQANVKADLYLEAEQDFEAFWARLAMTVIVT